MLFFSCLRNFVIGRYEAPAEHRLEGDNPYLFIALWVRDYLLPVDALRVPRRPASFLAVLLAMTELRCICLRSPVSSLRLIAPKKTNYRNTTI